MDFRLELSKAKILRSLTSDSLERGYLEGRMRGLRRRHHGENFRTEAEHAVWISMADDADPDRAARGRGYKNTLAEEV